jgi:hypothetical protein
MPGVVDKLSVNHALKAPTKCKLPKKGEIWILKTFAQTTAKMLDLIQQLNTSQARSSHIDKMSDLAEAAKPSKMK